MILKLKSLALRDGIIFRTHVDPRGSQTKQFIASEDISLEWDTNANIVTVDSKRHQQTRLIPVSNVVCGEPLPPKPKE